MKPKIVFCYTIANTFHFSTETVSLLKKRGFYIVLISSGDELLKSTALKLGVEYQKLEFQRNFSIFKDIVNLFKLYRILRKEKPDMVVGATPKAALSAMIASFFAGVKHRIYHIFGLTFETASGLKRKILTAVERITFMFATDVVCISPSVKDVYSSVFPSVLKKIRHVGILTVGGVDSSLFDRKRFEFDRDGIKQELGIPKEMMVIGFVARLTRDKGLDDLVSMWDRIRKQRNDVVLLVIGDVDSREAFDRNKLKTLYDDSRVFHLGFTRIVEKYMSVMDLFVLPSFREGFGNVNAEASAMEIPVVSYNVTGCKDSVKDGNSGILVEKNNIDALCHAVNFFLDNHDERQVFGRRGREYVESYFTREKVAEQFTRFCEGKLK